MVMTDLPQSDTKQPNPSPASLVGVSKERPQIASGDKQEVTPITEYTRKVDLEPEVEGWLEKSEREETQPPKPIVDKVSGQVILTTPESSGKEKFKVVLPLTKKEMEKGLEHKVVDSLRWLAEWCLKMIKMFGTKVAYRHSQKS